MWYAPLVVLPCARTVGQRDGPIKVLAVEAGGMRRAALEDDLSAQQAAVAQLIRGRPAFIIPLGARHPY